MNKSDFISELSKRSSFDTETVILFVDIISDIVSEGLLDDSKVKTPLGNFELVRRKSKRIKFIHNGEFGFLPERNVVKFYPKGKIEESING